MSPDRSVCVARLTESWLDTKAEPTRPAAGSLAAQQRRFNVLREEFNNERPREALDQETPAAYVGLEEIADGLWNVYFGPLGLGRLSERHMRIEDEYGRFYRRHV